MSNGPSPYDFRSRRPPPPPPYPPTPPEPPIPPSPPEELPIYRTYTTEVIDGTRWKTHLETDWEQVLTEDGVCLKDLLRSLPIYDEASFYRYKGILYNLPEVSAIDRLNNLSSPLVGDVWLVETLYLAEGKFVCEVYVYLGNEKGWVFHGSTNMRSTVAHYLPEILKLIPTTLGDANDLLMVTPDGRSISWGNPIKTHNEDPNAHPNLIQEIEDIIPDAAEEATTKVLEILSESVLVLDGGGQENETPDPDPDNEESNEIDPDSGNSNTEDPEGG